MAVLIIHRDPHEPFPDRQRFAEAGEDLVVLAALGDAEPGGLRPIPDVTHIEVLTDAGRPGAVLDRAHALAVRFGVRRVVALSDGDQHDAARVRERLGLPGIWTADLLPFRDRAEMRHRARRAGVAVAAGCLPRDADEAWAFARRHGYPLVARPRVGPGTVDLRSTADLAGHLATGGVGRTDADLWLLEAAVPGRSFDVDGLVAEGRLALAWPSWGRHDGSLGTDRMLDADDPMTPRLVDVAERALRAMDRPGGRMRDHAFHAEIVHTADDRLVLDVLAARPGDADTSEAFGERFGADLRELATRAQLGMPLDDIGALRRVPEQRAAAQVLPLRRRPQLTRASVAAA